MPTYIRCYASGDSRISGMLAMLRRMRGSSHCFSGKGRPLYGGGDRFVSRSICGLTRIGIAAGQWGPLRPARDVQGLRIPVSITAQHANAQSEIITNWPE